MRKVKNENKKFLTGKAEVDFRAAFGQRIRLARVKLRLTQAELAHSLGRGSNDTISRVERGEMKDIPFDLLGGLARMVEQAGHSVHWLLSGEEKQEQVRGEIIRRLTKELWPESTVPFAVREVVEPGYVEVPAENLPSKWAGRFVPILGWVAAGGGAPTIEADEHPAGIADTYVERPGSRPHLFAVKVVGDSMRPDFQPGDLVFFDPDSPAESGLACIRFLKDGEIFARLKRIKIGRKTVLLNSTNPAFPPEEIERKRFISAYKLVDHLPIARRIPAEGT